MVWQKGQARVGAGGSPMPDPVIEEEKKPVTPKKTTSSKSKKTEKKVEK